MWQVGAQNMQLGAHNQPKGKVVEVVKGATASQVRIDIGGAIVTASITNEPVDDPVGSCSPGITGAL
jgi:hypothetical protein